MVRQWVRQWAGFTVAVVLTGFSPAQAAEATVPQATQAERAMQRQALAKFLTPANYDLALHPATDQTHWRQVLWSMTLLQPTDIPAQQVLTQLLDLALTPNPGADLQPTLVQALKTGAALYTHPVQPNTRDSYRFVRDKLQALLAVSRNPGLVSLALATLARDPDAPDLSPWLPGLKTRLPLWFLDTGLRTTIEDLELPAAPLPPLVDLLRQQVTSLPSLYLLCRRDRSIPCLALLKDGQGHFYRSGEGVWHINLLARSIYPLAWNFNSGETPQGLLRLEGTILRTPQEFRAFGQFPSVKVFLPNEPGAMQFLPGVAATTPIDLGIYRSLWPLSWQNYRPVEQSFWAGKLGRSLIRIHGSGENPELFYPQPIDLPNPTIGCIGALEHYSPDGQLQQADLPRLLNAWNELQPGGMTGYLWLIEVPDPQGTNQPVNIQEIEPVLPT
ncbi:hypothetical protein [Anthocerotibacter panamensis]|uniref:hypothetical protein n=1 Tax=Anthocerotibacter panamensis TaxID=2857077 RepID=UPI001C401B36|nr:hypothetical protein [Anthocerotibacter panamensis]